MHRAASRRPNRRRGRRSRPAQCVLHRRQQRRRVEDDRLRPHLDDRSSTISRPARSAHLAVAPSNPNIIYVGSGEGLAAARSFGRRRHLQIDRRRQDLEAPRPARRPADRRGHRRSRKIRIASSSPCSAIRTVRTKSAASSARPTAARRGRRCSTRMKTPARSQVAFDPSNLADRLCRAVGRPAGAVGKRRVARARAAASSNRPMAATPGGSSPRGLPTFEQGLGRIGFDIAPQQSEAHLRDGRCRPAAGRHLSLRRRRRKLADASAATRALGPRQRLRRNQSRIRRIRTSFTSPTSCLVRLDRRRQDVGPAFKGAPGGDDYHRIWINPDNPRHHALRRRSGRDRHRQRRRDLELLVQPADRAVLSRHHRQPVSVLGLRRPAGERLGGDRQPGATTAQITFRDWRTVGVEEYGYVAPDPLNPNIIYGGKITRFD